MDRGRSLGTSKSFSEKGKVQGFIWCANTI